MCLRLKAMAGRLAVRDAHTGETRPARYGDMMILLRRRTGLARDATADLFPAVERLHLIRVGVGAHRADEGGVHADAPASNGLVRTLAALAGSQPGHDRLPPDGKFGAREGQILHDAADDDDVR